MNNKERKIWLKIFNITDSQIWNKIANSIEFPINLMTHEYSSKLHKQFPELFPEEITSTESSGDGSPMIFYPKMLHKRIIHQKLKEIFEDSTSANFSGIILTTQDKHE